jgi:multidrug efflux pump subunit AcrA (membrane-fusion protein)
LTFPHRSGYLEAIEVIRGSEVKEGDVLARIETGSLEMEIIRQKIIIEKQQLSIEEIRVLGGNRFTRRQAELTLELEEIRLQQLEHELEQAVITAPMDGVIIWMTDAAIGDFINARVPVLTIADPKHVHFEYTGLLMPQMHFGMEVEIQVGENLIPAKIAMNPADTPEEYVRERRERVFIIPNDPDDLPDEVVPGMRYGFRILLEEKHDVIIVPVSAVSTFSRQSFVQVLVDGLRTERDISIGIADGTNVEVLSGLYEGELLIIGIER